MNPKDQANVEVIESEPMAEHGWASEHENPGSLTLWRTWAMQVLRRTGAINRDELDGTGPLPEIEGDEDALASTASEDVAGMSREIEALELRLARMVGDPFNELAIELGLDACELRVAALLFNLTAHTACRKLLERLGLGAARHGELTIGTLLEALFPGADGEELVAARHLFHPSGRLITNEVVLVEGGRCGVAEEPELLTLELRLHPRIVNRLMGDNASYALLSTVLDVERPEVELDDVILPHAMKERVVETAGAWAMEGLDRAPSARHPLTMLFYGPSGTGKTMLARALASHLGRPLISLRSTHLKGALGPGGFLNRWDTDDLVRFMLREARNQGAIAFFDECDDIFREDSEESRILLIEIERQGGMVILATNKPARLDSALDRRLSLRIPFHNPGFDERHEIWRVHLLEQPLLEDVDAEALARQFFFPGGYIRNAVLLASMRRKGRPLSQDDLVAAGHEQQVHMKLESTSLIETLGASEAEAMEDMNTVRLQGVARALHDARAREAGLSIRFSGTSIEELKQAALLTARHAGMGLMLSHVGLEQTRSNGLTIMEFKHGSDLIEQIMSQVQMLPEDCLLAIVQDPPHQIDEIGTALRRIKARALVLEAWIQPPQPHKAFDLWLHVQPPEGKSRARAWRRVLREEGFDLEQEALEALASEHEVGGAFFRKIVRHAHWRALAMGFDGFDAEMLGESLRERRVGRQPGPLFG